MLTFMLYSPLRLKSLACGVYQVVNLPIIVRKDEDGYWDALIPDGEGKGDDYTISVGQASKADALKGVEKYLRQNLRFPQ